MPYLGLMRITDLPRVYPPGSAESSPVPVSVSAPAGRCQGRLGPIRCGDLDAWIRKIGLPLAMIGLCSTLSATAFAQKRRVELRFQGGVDVSVPIFLNVDRNIVKPGAGVSGWGGLDIGWIVFDFGLGLMGNTIKTDNIPEIEAAGGGIGDQPLIRWHFSPGIRLQVPTIDAVLPYVTGSFDANLWAFEALAVDCGWYYCRGEGRFRFAPGFTGKVGVGIRLKGPFYLDVGMKYAMSGKGEFFVRKQWWLEPFVGFLFRGGSDRFDGVGY